MEIIPHVAENNEKQLHPISDPLISIVMEIIPRVAENNEKQLHSISFPLDLLYAVK